MVSVSTERGRRSPVGSRRTWKETETLVFTGMPSRVVASTSCLRDCMRRSNTWAIVSPGFRKTSPGPSARTKLLPRVMAAASWLKRKPAPNSRKLGERVMTDGFLLLAVVVVVCSGSCRARPAGR